MLAALVLAPLLHLWLPRVAPPARRLEPWLAAMDDGDAGEGEGGAPALGDGEDAVVQTNPHPT